jgi:hypothetical protein
MNRLTIVRSLEAPVDRVWEIVGNPGVSPGPGVDVRVERPGAADGTGLTRTVKVGLVTAHEEVTGVGPGPVLRYRMVKGAPVRDYTGVVTLDETAGEGTSVSWAVEFRPVVPGTGWAISLATKRTLNKVLDVIARRLTNNERSTYVDTSLH